jgi:hypothetical protein
VYTLAGVWSLMRQASVFLAGDEQHKRLLRVYLEYQVASVRLRPLVGELVQIGLLVALLATLWFAHRVL